MAVEYPVDRPREPSNGELSMASSPIPKQAANPQDEIRAVARTISDQLLTNPEPGVWAVLTAISKNARLRPQGVNMLLTEDELCIGRRVEDRFQINSISISANHCQISRERETHIDVKAESSTPFTVFLRDTSTNGTYLNWVKLRKNSKARLTHGDIVSFVSVPHGDNSYAFVYREVPGSNIEGLKRKSEDFNNESKRLKGIGIGAPDGPISLDDVRSLQRSNMELRQQLESHVLTIEGLHSENRLINARHENELKELKETVSNSYHYQIKDLLNVLEAKQKELGDLSATSAEMQNSIKDLNERLNASLQSRADADKIINSQKVTISELESQLDEERNQRREEREKAEMDLKSAIQKAHFEAQEEIKRQADVYLRQHREHLDLITKLQDSEKESRLLMEMLRSKLEDARESLVTSEKKARQLEAQFQDELMASANSRKKMEVAESELQKLRREVENEKVAREEAWGKVSSLELEIAAAIRDLSIEKQRFQGARERIILRETQLRAFYSTTEEISALFSRQQEQLKAMQKTLEDEENYENSLFAVDSSKLGNLNFSMAQPREKPKESSSTSTPKNSLFKIDGKDHLDDDNSEDEDVCTTQKNDYQNDSQDDNTQDLEGGSADRLARAFGSDIEGVGTEVIPDLNQTDTERVLGTESQIDERGAALALLKCSNFAGDTMQIDEVVAQDKHEEPLAGHFDLKTSPTSQQGKEDNEPSTIRTADLLASEAVGSWAIDTAPSVYGENESPEDHGIGNEANAATECQMLGSVAQAAGSQSNSARSITKLTKEHRALSAMIDIVEPDFRQKFLGVTQSESPSDAETEEGSNHSKASGKDDDDSDGDSSADDETNGVDVMIEDSVG